MTVHDAEEKSQRSLWGLTRTLINNAVVGVAEGYSVDIKLVGVGYRAAVEPIPPVNLNLNKQLRQRREAEGKASAEELAVPLPTDRLNIKLGYAHPILIDIPHGITVATPAPTQIVLKGTDKQRLGLFAAKIRRYRKPEPYRGKVSLVANHCLPSASTGRRLERQADCTGCIRQWRDDQAQGDQEEVARCPANFRCTETLRPTSASSTAGTGSGRLSDSLPLTQRGTSPAPSDFILAQWIAHAQIHDKAAGQPATLSLERPEGYEPPEPRLVRHH